MRVPDSSYYNMLLPQLERLNAKQINLQNQAATGQRVFRASEDPAAVGRALELQGEKDQIQQFARNISRGEAVSNASFNSIEGMQEILLRSDEIAVKANGLTSKDGFPAYAIEVDKMLEDFVNLANSTYLGEYLHAGTATQTAPFEVTRTGPDGQIDSATYVGHADNLPTFRITETQDFSPFSRTSTNAAMVDAMDNLMALRQALSDEDVPAIQAAQQAIRTQEDVLIEEMSLIGSRLTTLEIVGKRSEQAFYNYETTISDNVDADLTETLVQLNSASIAYEAALQSGAQIMNLSLLNYI
ncbi:MAG: hypothetical protein ACFB20_06725 [Opitutales bacterium]